MPVQHILMIGPNLINKMLFHVSRLIIVLFFFTTRDVNKMIDTEKEEEGKGESILVLMISFQLVSKSFNFEI